MSRATIELIINRLVELTGVEWNVYVTFIAPGYLSVPSERMVLEGEYDTVVLDQGITFKTDQFKTLEQAFEVANRLNPQIWTEMRIFSYSVIVHYESLNIQDLLDDPIPVPITYKQFDLMSELFLTINHG